MPSTLQRLDRLIGSFSVGLAATVLPLTALAQEDGSFRCTLDDAVRRVEVTRQTSAPVPCSVMYHKDTEAPDAAPEELWNAQNEAGYCEARAAEFVAQLESWGWQCEQAARSEGD